MRVVLIFPTMTLKAPEQPLGILYIAGCLRRQGHEVKVVDMTPQCVDMSALMEIIGDFKPRVVGVSCMVTTSRTGCDIAKMLKKNMPEIISVAGGPHVTAWPEHFVRLGGFDYAFVGEGEIDFTRFVDMLAAGDPSADQTHGLVYLKAGTLVRNPRAQRVTDLDTLPLPARDLVDMNAYTHNPQYFISLGMIGRNFNILLARGCPYHCNFCDHTLFGHKLIERAIPKVLDEIEDVWNTYNIPNMEIDDDTFTLNLERVAEFCNGLIDRGLSHIKWSARCRVSGITPEVLKLMAEAGCVHVSFGIESIDESVLKRIRKNITRQQVDAATRWAKEAGMKVVANFMIGNIGDDESSVMSSLNYALNNDNIDIPSFTVITPLKNTEVYQIAMEKGWIRNTDWDYYNQKSVNMRNEDLDYEDIERLHQHIRSAIHDKVRKTMHQMEQAWETHELSKPSSPTA